ncbi:MAG: MgtC/SapB family protein [Actinomycetota bacterium]|nr:MgtC/SapB family protein [Actinomycetota bacterium]
MNQYGIELDIVVRLVTAFVLGAVVGLEREAGDQPAGLRTHIAVTVGAALFGVISTEGFTAFDRPRADSTLQADVTRVASQVVVGVGFLGAGMIFRQRSQVRNLTTAASVWVAAAIGLAVGVGLVAVAAATTLLIAFSLVLLKPVRDYIGRHSARSRRVSFRLAPGADPTDFLRRLEGRDDLDLKDVMYEKADGQPVVVVTLETRGDARLTTELATLVRSAEVEKVKGL